MKIRYFIFFLAALTITACEKFLDPDSLSTFDDYYIFSNAEDARKAVNAIYVHFSHDGFRSRLSNNMTGNTDIEHSSGWTSDGARYQLWDLRAQENNGDLGYVWDIGYKAIRDANICIEGIQASSALNSSDAVVSREMYNLLGEAYTLRAYWYSMLVFYFGDVPFITEAPKVGVEFNLPKASRITILDSIINDLINIEDKMKWADECSFGIEQVNRDYTMGMIARLALQRGGWYLYSDSATAMEMRREADYLDYYQIAKDYTAKYIELRDRPLPKDFRQIFMNECKFVTDHEYGGEINEILFEVPFAVGEGDVGWNIGIRVDASTVPGLNPYGSGSNYMAMPPTYVYSFDSLDKRFEVTCGFYTINTDYQKVLVSTGNMNVSQGKWSRHFLKDPPGPSTNKGTGINWPMMRYADVLLMFAEAENELNGPTAEAQAAFKRVRQRAFDASVDPYMASISVSKDAFFNAIVDERAWEFGGEMTRRYDLIRWNLYHTKISKMVEDLKKMADDAFLGTGTLPDYLYTKNDVNGDLLIYNKFTKEIPADTTWTRQSWLINMWDDTKNNYKDWIIKDWARYTDPVRYIFPIPTMGIDNSKGVLKNDGYQFWEW